MRVSHRNVFAVVAMAVLGGVPALRAQAPVQVRIVTDSGTIVVALEPTKAPATVANFLKYVDEHRYDGGSFYRAVTLQNQLPAVQQPQIEVIQGGIDADSSKRLPAIAHETNDKSGIKHTDGVISMARGAPGSASSEFFFVINDQPALDFGGKRNPDGQGFAAFGRVVSGMDVVRRIQRMPSTPQPPQRMTTVVRIQRVERAR
jgi:peptidyl-prolyl cis-trans isomerase A (cyclophilin A)